MTKLNKWILINCLISILMYCYIFIKCAGKSGGDMAIYAYNIIFGIIQILTVLILIRKKPNTFYKVILFIIFCQIIEIIIMTIWGYRINTFIKTH